MTVSTEVTKSATTVGNGVTTAFPFAFKIFQTSDVSVVLAVVATGVETVLTEGVDYSVSMNADQEADPGGEVTYPLSGSPMASTHSLTLVRDVPYTQGLDLTLGGNFNPDNIEQALDRSTVQIQQVNEAVSRSLKTAVSTPPGADPTLPAPVPYALVGWNAAGDGLQNTDPTYSTILATDLASTASGKGDALIGYLAAGTGATGRTVHARLADMVLSVKDFGALGDGVTDDTAAMQAAHDTGKLIYYPPGNYRFTTLSFSAGGIIGAGAALSQLETTNATSSDIITYTGTSGDGQVPLFRDFKLEAINTKAAGAAIRFTPSSGELSYADISSVTIYNVPRSLQFDACAKWKVSKCNLLNYSDMGILVANSNDIDSGDCLIEGCFINTGMPSGNRFAIYQESAAGLRVVGNKILGGTGGYVLAYKGNTQSGPLIITGNSIENVAGYAVYLGHTATYTGIFGGTVIVGNEIAVCDNGIVTEASSALTEVTVVGNYINLNNATGSHVSFNDVDKFLIASNTFIDGATAVNIVSNCTNGKIGTNIYSGQAIASVSNNSSTTFVETDEQSGVVASITHTTAFGTLFHGSSSVVFPTAFSIAPTVYCNAGGGPGVSGGFCAYATNVSTTGFTYNIVSVTSGATATNSWSARGVI